MLRDPYKRRAFSIGALDHSQDLPLLRRVLVRRGFEVRPFCRVQEASLKWTLSPPAPLIIEPDVLGSNIAEVCRAVRSNPATSLLPIIVLSHHAEEADKVVALEAGADTTCQAFR